TVITQFTNTILESIERIVPGNNKFIFLTNKTTRVLTLKQLSGTATNQIDTVVDGDLDLENNSSIMLYRDTTSNVWRVIGGTGSGGGGGSTALNFRYINGAMGPTFYEDIPSFFKFS